MRLVLILAYAALLASCGAVVVKQWVQVHSHQPREIGSINWSQQSLADLAPRGDDCPGRYPYRDDAGFILFCWGSKP